MNKHIRKAGQELARAAFVSPITTLHADSASETRVSNTRRWLGAVAATIMLPGITHSIYVAFPGWLTFVPYVVALVLGGCVWLRRLSLHASRRKTSASSSTQPSGSDGQRPITIRQLWTASRDMFAQRKEPTPVVKEQPQFTPGAQVATLAVVLGVLAVLCGVAAPLLPVAAIASLPDWVAVTTSFHPLISAGGYFAVLTVLSVAVRRHVKGQSSDLNQQALWRERLAVICRVTTAQWESGGGSFKLSADESTLTVIFPVRATGTTRSLVEEGLARQLPGWIIDELTHQTMALRRAPEGDPALLQRARLASTDGLVVNEYTAESTLTRPNQVVWELKPGERPDIRRLNHLALQRGLTLVDLDLTSGRAYLANVPAPTVELRDALAGLLGHDPWQLEIVRHVVEGRVVGVGFMRFPAELDRRKQDDRYLLALTNTLGTDGLWSLRLVQRTLIAEWRPDPLAHVHPYDWDAPVSLSRVPFGVDESGETAWLGLIENNILLGGIPGGGKSGGITAFLAGVSRLEHVAVVALDPKRVELALWAPRASCIAELPDDALLVLESLTEEMDRRYEYLRNAGLKKISPSQISAQRPLLVLIVDELANLVSLGIDKARDGAISTAIRNLVAMGRAAGIVVVAATQKPQGTVVPTELRDLIQQRVAFSTTNSDMTETILGKGMSANGGLSHQIASAEKGVAYVVNEDSRQPQRARAFWIPDEDVAGIALRTAHLRVELPWLVSPPASRYAQPKPDVVEKTQLTVSLDDLEAFSFDPEPHTT